MGLSLRAYAAHLRVTEGSVRKAVRAGRITPEPDGTIDPAKADVQWQANTDPARQTTTKPKFANPQPHDTASAAAVRSVREALRESGQSSAGLTSFEQARTAHEITKVHLARLLLQEKRGSLIDKAKVTAQVFRLARQVRDAWLNWPARVSAQMAAELGVDEHAMHTMLERYVRDHLTELGDIRPKFE